MIDFRVNVIGASGQNDTMFVVLFQPAQRFFSLFLNIKAGSGHFIPTGGSGMHDLRCRNFCKFLHERLRRRLQIGKSHKRITELYFSACNGIHIVTDIFGIGSYDRAVIVICSTRYLIPFIEKSRIKDKVNTLPDQPFNMSM